jgi:hypothetical protein
VVVVGGCAAKNRSFKPLASCCDHARSTGPAGPASHGGGPRGGGGGGTLQPVFMPQVCGALRRGSCWIDKGLLLP